MLIKAMKKVNMRFISVIVLTFSCAHDPQPQDMERAILKARCERPQIYFKPYRWLAEDEHMLPRFEIGCVKHYTDNHCPSIVRKTGTLSYRVLCKKTTP